MFPGDRSVGKEADDKPVLTTGNSSGVTIGTGVDLGAMKQADLDKLKKMGDLQETVDKLKPLIGKKREEALRRCARRRVVKPWFWTRKMWN